MPIFKNCDECGNNCLSSDINIIRCDNDINIIRCDNHNTIEDYIKSVCYNCIPQSIDNKNWNVNLLKDYKIDVLKLECSDITYYEKCNNYNIIKINTKKIYKMQYLHKKIY